MRNGIKAGACDGDHAHCMRWGQGRCACRDCAHEAVDPCMGVCMVDLVVQCRGFVVRGKEIDCKATARRVEEGELAERHAAAKRVWKGRWHKHGTHMRRRVRAQRPAVRLAMLVFLPTVCAFLTSSNGEY